MMNTRVRRPKDQEYIYQELTDKKEFGVFESYKDLFMLSMVVGFLEGKRSPFTESLELIHWQVFNLTTDEPVINMVAYLETNNLEFIYDYSEEKFKEKIKIAEEYAASGANKVYNVFMSDQKNALQKIMDYVQEFADIEDYDTWKKKSLVNDLL
ncbi:hypothetical protein [Halobacillus faecis]|uniref:Uncharacterized protein n=2 Tax=Halobacillus TaxID=45667 RepID=A0A511WT08_9BACI|nr:hypothetical protein [Halobacillus faecis]GEN52412.1 hypothetical protein HFA01_06740 [Halobacillus faecis]